MSNLVQGKQKAVVGAVVAGVVAAVSAYFGVNSVVTVAVVSVLTAAGVYQVKNK